MSKTRQKQHSEKDHLLAQIKKLKSENRYLKKRNKALEKWAREADDIEEEPAAPEIEIKDIDKCPSCKKGTLSFVDAFHIQILKCNNCDYREKSNDAEKKKEKTKRA